MPPRTQPPRCGTPLGVGSDRGGRHVSFAGTQKLLQRRQIRKSCASLDHNCKYDGHYGEEQRAIKSRQKASDRKTWLADTRPHMFWGWGDPDRSEGKARHAENLACKLELEVQGKPWPRPLLLHAAPMER